MNRFTQTRHETRTGFDDVKKSISFPTVNGMLSDTDEDTRSNPTAMSSGRRSGRARETIFLNDDVDELSFNEEEVNNVGRKRERRG